MNAEQLRPLARVSGLDLPVLIAAGAADRHTTAKETASLMAAAKGPKALWLVPGAAHVDLYHFAPAAYEAKILGFFTTHLRSARPGASSRPSPAPHDPQAP